MKDLPQTWMFNGKRFTHAGFSVCRKRGRLSTSTPIDLYEHVEEALEAAERAGLEYAAYRIGQSGGEIEPKELITRNDLPVTIEGLGH